MPDWQKEEDSIVYAWVDWFENNLRLFGLLALLFIGAVIGTVMSATGSLDAVWDETQPFVTIVMLIAAVVLFEGAIPLWLSWDDDQRREILIVFLVAAGTATLAVLAVYYVWARLLFGGAALFIAVILYCMYKHHMSLPSREC